MAGVVRLQGVVPGLLQFGVVRVQLPGVLQGMVVVKLLLKCVFLGPSGSATNITQITFVVVVTTVLTNRTLRSFVVVAVQQLSLEGSF